MTAKSSPRKPAEVTWSFCNACGQETKHARRCELNRSSWSDSDEFSIEFGTQWRLLQCEGCEEVTLARRDWCSEDMDDYGRRGGAGFTFFPPRSSRREPDWMKRLRPPREYGDLLDEIYVALHADSRRLAMMGARALIDLFIQRTVGDQGNFPAGLTALVEGEFLGKKQREVLEAALDVGHASSHRAHFPDQGSVATVMDIVENLIHNELLRGEKEMLRAKTPPRDSRQPRQKKAKA